MATRPCRPKEITAELREAEVLLGRGRKVAEVVKEPDIHELTHARWRKESGAMQVDPMKRPKESGQQNARLR